MRPEMPVRVVRALVDESGAVVIPAGSEVRGRPHLTRANTWMVRYSIGGAPRASAVPASAVEHAEPRGLDWPLALTGIVVVAVALGAAFLGRV